MVSGFLSGAAGGATVAIVIKAVDQFSQQFSSVNKKALALGATMTAVGAAGVVAFGKIALEAGKATGRIDAFNNMFGKEAPKALQRLKEATRGTVSDIELMTQANQALLLGIDEKALPRMFEGAFAAAQATGRPVANAIADITTGIGRQSRLILDNLGIIVKQEEANEAYAASLGKTVSELTDAERKTAFMNATMEALILNQEKIGDIQDSLSIKTQRMGAAWDNLKQSIGQALIPILDQLAEYLQPVLNFFTEHEQVTTMAGAILAAVAALLGLAGVMTMLAAINPIILLIVTALGVLTAAALWWSKNWKQAVQDTLFVLGHLVIRMIWFKDWFVDSMKLMWESIKNLFKMGWNSIISDAESAINAMIRLLNKIPGVSISTVSFEGFKLPISDTQQMSRELQSARMEKALGMMQNLKNNLPFQEDNISMAIADSQASETIKKADEQVQLLEQLKDFKVLPSGEIFNPRGFGTADFERRFDYEQAKRGAGVSITIDNVYGLDAEEVSRALSNELGNKISR